MTLSVPSLLRSLGLGVGVAALLAACAGPPPESGRELAGRAARAMGADKLTTLRYSGEGTGWTFGQAFVPGGAWPKITLHSVTRSIDYANGAMREEVTLSRAEPQGGGGYPLSGQQRNDQYLSGEIAWNLAGTTAAPGPRFVTDRVHQLWITPHGALKAAERNRASMLGGSSAFVEQLAREDMAAGSRPGCCDGVLHLGVRSRSACQQGKSGGVQVWAHGFGGSKMRYGRVVGAILFGFRSGYFP